MRNSTYNRLENLYKKCKGYISTRELLDEGFSNRQIAVLAEEKYLEKVCYGYYWLLQCGRKKPADYKCIEASLSNPRAVIAMESACFYQGMIKEEPPFLAVATERADRSAMKMNFPVKRHYFSNPKFQVGMQEVQTEFGSYHMYDVERSFCDMARLGGKQKEGRLAAEVLKALKANEKQYGRVLRYAEMFRLKL